MNRADEIERAKESVRAYLKSRDSHRDIIDAGAHAAIWMAAQRDLALPRASEPGEAQVEAAALAMLREDLALAGRAGETAEAMWAAGSDAQRNAARNSARRVLRAASEAGR